jgi:hypothetical protein
MIIIFYVFGICFLILVISDNVPTINVTSVMFSKSNIFSQFLYFILVMLGLASGIKFRNWRFVLEMCNISYSSVFSSVLFKHVSCSLCSILNVAFLNPSHLFRFFFLQSHDYSSHYVLLNNLFIDDPSV